MRPPQPTRQPSSVASEEMARRRTRMVEHQLRGRGVRDHAVLTAMGEVPREAFVPEDVHDYAYEDGPLPIGEGQTISQPFIVAMMAETLELEPSDRVLEIGTGSGYVAAILSRIVAEVVTVERHEALADSARERLRSLDYDNVTVVHGDGTKGFPDRAPYDAITVAAAGPGVPESLPEQLASGGRLVIPVGPSRYQRLVRITRVGEDRYEEEELDRVRFVPLIGEEGWNGVKSDAGDDARLIYRPESELQSHYFQAALPRQFDEWIFVEESEAVTPLVTEDLGGVPDTYPFGV